MTKFKEFSVVIVAIMALIAITVFATAPVETHTTRTGAPTDKRGVASFKKCTVADASGTVVDFTETIDNVYGILHRIVIDSAGTDTSYKVYLKDENAVAIFTKTDCNSLTEPHSYALFEDDTNGDPHKGVAVGGTCSIEVADADDASMSSISVIVYYTSYWD